MKKIISVLLAFTLLIGNFAYFNVYAAPLTERDLDIKWIDGEYSEITPFEDGVAIISGMGGASDKKYGLINKDGKLIVPLKYDYMGLFVDGLAKVGIGDWKNRKFGYIDKEGNELWTIEEDFPRVEKSQEDIDIERELVRSRMLAGGAPPAMAESYEPDEYKSMIASLSVDSMNRLWVMSGLYDGGVFRVYDGDTGEFLFTAALRTDEYHENVTPFITKHGIVAFDAVSDEWHRVYTIEPEDPSLFTE